MPAAAEDLQHEYGDRIEAEERLQHVDRGLEEEDGEDAVGVEPAEHAALLGRRRAQTLDQERGGHDDHGCPGAALGPDGGVDQVGPVRNFQHATRAGKVREQVGRRLQHDRDRVAGGDKRSREGAAKASAREREQHVQHHRDRRLAEYQPDRNQRRHVGVLECGEEQAQPTEAEQCAGAVARSSQPGDEASEDIEDGRAHEQQQRPDGFARAVHEQRAVDAGKHQQRHAE